MADPRLDYDPVEGWLNSTIFKDNPSDPEVRPMFQRLFTQVQTFINTTLIAWANSLSTALQSQITLNGGDITTLKGRTTSSETNISSLQVNKADSSNVYTKIELDPFLCGGDTLIMYEVFSIISSNNGNGTFTYKDKNNNNIIGTLNVSGYQIFTLLEGNYVISQNRINMTINDTLQRSTASGGLLEIDGTHIALTSPEGAGAEITIQYFQRVGITGTGLIVQGVVEPPSGFVWYKEV